MAQTHFRSQQLGMFSVDLAGLAATTGGAIASIPNPEGETLIILRSYLYVRTPSTGAANLSVGIGAAIDTAATDIINALAVGGSITGKYYNGQAQQVSAKTEVSAPAPWTADKFLNVSGSATTVGLDAVLYVEYLRVGTAEE